jgi:small-conductance mechanosensitive channel
MFEKFSHSRYFSSYEFFPVNAVLATVAAVATYVVLRALVAFFRKRLCRLSDDRAHATWAEILKQTLASTSGLAIAATSVLVGLSLLTLPAPWDERVRHLWFIGLGVQVAIYLHRAISIGAKHYFRSHTQNPGDSLTVAHTLVIWGLQTALWVVFALAILSNLGINISTFIASLGIGGIAIALAVQNILGDLFASLSIAVDKPFEVGDAISVVGFTGTVEHVGLKTTRIRSDSGEQIVIANSELLKSTVRNFKRMSRRRVQFSLRINANTPPQLAAKVPPAVREIVEKQDDVQFERAHLKAIEQSALEFDIVYYVLQPAYALFMDRQQAVLLQLLETLATLGISTAPAAQPVLLREEPRRSVNTNLGVVPSKILTQK